MVAPLIVQGRTIGLLSVYRDRREGLFTQVDLDFLVGLARQAAVALENARLFAEIQRQKQLSEALVQTSPVAIVTTDQGNRVDVVEPGGGEAVRLPAGGSAGRGPQRARSSIRKCRSCGQRPRSSQTRRWLAVACTPSPNAAGETEAW